jgi:hypothetical protein
MIGCSGAIPTHGWRHGGDAMKTDRERLARLLRQYAKIACREEAGAEWPVIRRALEAEAAELGLRVPWQALPRVATNLTLLRGRKPR